MSNTQTLAEAPEDPGLSRHGHAPQRFWILTLGSIGVVYGDIGTSPLYALREAVKAASGGGEITPSLINGVLSLIFWALILVVTIKYVLVLLNADNKGEGGTLSLMALAQRGRGKFLAIIPILGMIGAALFYGDAMITPAISVLSAIEGLKIVTPAFEPFILWITLVVILGLFLVQSAGTAKVAAIFGPVTLIWFAAIAAAGIPHIITEPSVLLSVNPLHAILFLADHGIIGLITLGAVFLAVTGAEALYADLGHFGKKPIRFAWLVVVLPALMLNYWGQGAFLLHTPAALENPFFLMVPSWALLPMVALATAATNIASQAVITGAFSLTRQAVQLGILPRMQIRFTSESQSGQIYLPQVNCLLMLGVFGLVLAFGDSSSLSTAYGIAVTGTMVVTAILAMFVIRNRWKWSLPATLALMLPLLALDVIFLGANSLKIKEGGWLPLAIGATIVLLMWTWRTGTRQLQDKSRAMEAGLKPLVQSLARKPPHLVPGTAVFFTPEAHSAPTALLHSLKHYKVLHETNIIFTLHTADVPFTPLQGKVQFVSHSPQFKSVEATIGYMETPDVPKLLKMAEPLGLTFNAQQASYFLSRKSVIAVPGGAMPQWQDKLFIAMAKASDDASHYFRLPTDRVVEVGNQITI